MYCQLAFLVTSLALSVTATPIDLVPIAQRDITLHRPATPRALVKRDANASFPLNFELKNETLFSGEWEVPALVPGVEEATASLEVTCIECRTQGDIVASAIFPDDIGDLIDAAADFNPFNDAALALTFNGVGAFVNLGVLASAEGEFAIPLLPPAQPLGIEGPGFQIGITFGIDLVIGVTGEIETTGGFEVSIPCGSTFMLTLDPAKENGANFDGAMASFLPLTGSAGVNLTTALRFSVEAGIDLPDLAIVDAQALAGASLNIPEVTLGVSVAADELCIPAFAEININAGAFIDIGAEISNIDLVDFNPQVSTTLFSALATTSFGNCGGVEIPPTPPATLPAATATSAIACPTALVTETKVETITQAVKSCAAGVANCPASLIQEIVATEVKTVITSSCPVLASANITMPVPAYPSLNATATTTALVTPTSAPNLCADTAATTSIPGGVPLTRLTEPVTSTLSVDPAVTPPAEATVTASAPAKPEESIPAAVNAGEEMQDVYTTIKYEPEPAASEVVGAITVTHLVTVPAADCACATAGLAA